MDTKCIVWEWQEGSRLWYPYSARISRYLEEKFNEKPRPSATNLGDCEPAMSCYDVDLFAMTQMRADTGTKRGIRRTVLPLDSPFAIGVVWEWRGDYSWIQYDAQTSCDLEKAMTLNHPILDLSSTLLHIPNIVDLNKMLQINKHSKYQRRVQRRTDTSVLYPREKGGASNATVKSPLRKNKARNKDTRVSGSTAQTSASEFSNDIVNPTKKLRTGDHPLIQDFTTMVSNPPNEECPICFEKLSEDSGFSQPAGAASASTSDVRQLSKCKHFFHKQCLIELLKTVSKNGGLQCPTCKTIHGTKQGIQPVNGSMNVTTSNQSLPGFPGCGMVTIVYTFQRGVQGPEHPHPGKPYQVIGFPRTCYLPDNEKGKKILRLLKKAWDRRLTFTIARSVTMGIDDVVVWNEIHHKTEAFSNSTGHGYPDPNYLDNVLAELASQGVQDDDGS